MLLAKKMGFVNQVVNFGPIFHRRDAATSSGFQIDLAYMRNDNVITICKIKKFKIS